MRSGEQLAVVGFGDSKCAEIVHQTHTPEGSFYRSVQPSPRLDISIQASNPTNI
jgi:hypothetical protein